MFGLNGFFHFIHQPSPQKPLAIELLAAVAASHLAAFFFIQVLGGLLLLSGFFVPFALTLLAAELYNILAFHLTLEPGIAPGLVACVLWVLVFFIAKISTASSERSLQNSFKVLDARY